MEKTQKVQSSVVLKKTEGEKEKILFRLNKENIMQLIGCFIFGSASVFSGMTPFGLGFYSSVFKKDSWLLCYIVSVLSVLLFATRTGILYIASLTLVTAVLAVLDNGNSKWKKGIFSSLVFFAVRISHVVAVDFDAYNVFDAIVETGLVFVSAFVFENSFHIVTSFGKRSFVSVKECVCIMSLFAIVSLSLADFEPVFGFNPANVFSVFLIYIFSLGGINGGAVVLGVLLGAVGSLKAGSFSDITSTFAFGALLGSALSSHGKVAVVLGFIIANTTAAFVFSDSANVAIGIYDSIAASILFFLVPDKYCTHILSVFRKTSSVVSGDTAYSHASAVAEKRLEKISHSLGELRDIYMSGAGERPLGKDYLSVKFNEVISSACIGCSSKAKCFKNKDSKGYFYMTKMLDTAFKNGKVSLLTLPPEFKNECKRSSSFAEKFNSAFAVIKTERQWASKLDECRSLVAEQLGALSQSLKKESSRCRLKIDTHTEEALWTEFDKIMLYPERIIAEKYPGGNFCISVYMPSGKIESDTEDKITKIVSETVACNLVCANPKADGTSYVYSFYPSKKFTLSTGSASRCKEDEKISGDSFSVVKGEGSCVNIILSDGMGSGSGAARESKTVAELTEKFLNAGVESRIAVKLVNSSLLLRSVRDSFSTVDLCSVNLADAQFEIIKLGAAKSYIKSGKQISCIKPASLPAGILIDTDAETHHFSIDSDTVIVLMSDGIADIELKYPQYEGWIESELEKINTSNPQLLATKLVERASALVDNKIFDDMTVVAVSIQKV